LKKYSLNILKLDCSLPNKQAVQILGRQLLRSATSVGAQYYEGCRAKSKADFISKIEGSLKELEESIYWLELLKECEMVDFLDFEEHLKETRELNAILTASVKKVKSNK
jgi:four helix bundle protein